MAEKDLTLSLDFGGTRTAIVMQTKEGHVVAAATVATNEAAGESLKPALDAIIDQALKNEIASDKDELLERINSLYIGTTIFINALTQLSPQLEKVMHVRICRPSSTTTPPFVGIPKAENANDSLVEHAVDSFASIHGEVYLDGKQKTPLYHKEIERVANYVMENKIPAVSIAGMNSFKNPDLELRVKQELETIFKANNYGPVRFSLSHAFKRPGLVARENTTALNASLSQLADTWLKGLESLICEMFGENDPPPLFLIGSNGTCMTPDKARKKPILLSGSGPINSLEGANSYLNHLNKNKDEANKITRAVVVDAGGSTTDVGRIKHGMPVMRSSTGTIKDIPFNVEHPLGQSLNIAGGTRIYFDDDNITIGPKSVEKKWREKSMLFCPKDKDISTRKFTLTDLACAAGRHHLLNMGEEDDLIKHNIERIQSKFGEKIEAIYQLMLEKLAEKIAGACNWEGNPPIVVIGGFAPAFAREPAFIDALEKHLQYRPEIHVPDDPEVVNAMGAARGLIYKTETQIYAVQKTSKDDDNKPISSNIEEAAIKAAINTAFDAAREVAIKAAISTTIDADNKATIKAAISAAVDAERETAIKAAVDAAKDAAIKAAKEAAIKAAVKTAIDDCKKYLCKSDNSALRVETAAQDASAVFGHVNTKDVPVFTTISDGPKTRDEAIKKAVRNLTKKIIKAGGGDYIDWQIEGEGFPIYDPDGRRWVTVGAYAKYIPGAKLRRKAEAEKILKRTVEERPLVDYSYDEPPQKIQIHRISEADQASRIYKIERPDDETKIPGTEERLITAEEIEYIRRGAGILSSGGAGSPNDAAAAVKAMLLQGAKLRLVDLREFASADVNHEESFVIPISCGGSPEGIQESLRSVAELVSLIEAEAARLKKEHPDKKINIAGIMPFEAAGVNLFVAMMASLITGYRLLDCDLMGRAFPLADNNTLNIGNAPIVNPVMMLSGSNGELTKVPLKNWQIADPEFRKYVDKYNGMVAATYCSMPLSVACKHAIPGTVSLALEMGRAIINADAKKIGSNCLKNQELTDATKKHGYENHEPLCHGRIAHVYQIPLTGFNAGIAVVKPELPLKTMSIIHQGITVEAIGMLVYFQNENLMAIAIKEDGTEVILETTPNIINLHDRDNAEVLYGEQYRAGQRVTLHTVTVPEILRSTRAFEVLVPAELKDRVIGFQKPIDADTNQASTHEQKNPAVSTGAPNVQKNPAVSTGATADNMSASASEQKSAVLSPNPGRSRHTLHGVPRTYQEKREENTATLEERFAKIEALLTHTSAAHDSDPWKTRPQCQKEIEWLLDYLSSDTPPMAPSPTMVPPQQGNNDLRTSTSSPKIGGMSSQS